MDPSLGLGNREVLAAQIGCTSVPFRNWCAPREKSQKANQDEICSVIRQITATVIFLPLLEVSYQDLIVPEKWEELGPQFIINTEEVYLHSFTNMIYN
ncbi:mitotic spindle assembly checkpoint protein MAD2A-like [Castor canadensis]|uniref:Mitotic spindle assembly checkpoint protein MAD2A-like n=1 Tax=Castor canadensis TaxID=51338 RepID=A0AC58ML06_CASCN